MGINLAFVCHKHKLQHTPLRGKEGAAFQALVRVHPECFKTGEVYAYRDGFLDPDLAYEDFFPKFHETVIKRDIKDDDLYAEIIEEDYMRRMGVNRV